MKEMKVLFVLPVIGHPRDSKRISMLKNSGFRVRVLSFQRTYHQGRLPDCFVEELGRIGDGRYLYRIAMLLAVVPKVRRAIKNSEVVYASGSDLAFLALLAGLGLNKPIVVEVGDIRAIQVTPGMRGRLVRFFDQMAVDRAKLLVVTARGFLEQYYRSWLRIRTPALIIENKLEYDSILEKTDISPSLDKPNRKRICIGYFGNLRCMRSWEILKCLANNYLDKFEVVIAGMSILPSDLQAQVDELPNIRYLGEFRSPQDLPGLYAQVDIVWACYPHPTPGEQNWQWARTNRFYESCFFKKPIIALEGSGDAGEVERNGIGLVLDTGNEEASIRRLNAITWRDLQSWRANLQTLDPGMYLYTSEGDDLKTAILNLRQATQGNDLAERTAR